MKKEELIQNELENLQFIISSVYNDIEKLDFENLDIVDLIQWCLHFETRLFRARIKAERTINQ